MVQKRPLVGDLCEVSYKHPRRLEHSDHLVSCLEFPSEDVSWKSHTSGDGKDGFRKCIPEHDVDPETGKDTENSFGRISNSSWVSSCTSEEDLRLEAPSHISVSPNYDDFDRPTRTFVYSKDAYSYLLELPPRKLVSIGQDFQADLPEWCPNGDKGTHVCPNSAETLLLCSRVSSSRSNLINHFNDENKLLGITVTPMPGMGPSTCSDDGVGFDRTVCCCPDPGSISCVRKHIVNARENLKRSVGQESFAGLGFHEMGEVVAEQWSEKDEQVFQDVVISNPSSKGKNFWDCLSLVFPSRTKKEIVSYYFNVFMLRKRAEQNRCIPINIDSDDDGWPDCDDESAASEEGAISEEEDDESVVESPLWRGIPAWSGIHDDDLHVYVSGIVKGASHRSGDYGHGLERISTASNTCLGSVPRLCASQTNLLDVRGNRDNDHLHTSSGIDAEILGTQPKDSSKGFAATYDGVGGEGSHDCFLDPWDAKVLGIGYSACPTIDTEFLPTCNMIEEVFGVGSWDYKIGDDKLV